LQEEGGQPRVAAARGVSAAPRLGFLVPAFFSALPLAALFLAVNMAGPGGAGSAELVFGLVYLAALPPVAAGVYNVARLLGEAGCGGLPQPVALAALAPGLYSVALSFAARRLRGCGVPGFEAPGSPLFDALLSLATVGLHTMVVAVGFERMLDVAYSRLVAGQKPR